MWERERVFGRYEAESWVGHGVGVVCIGDAGVVDGGGLCGWGCGVGLVGEGVDCLVRFLFWILLWDGDVLFDEQHDKGRDARVQREKRKGGNNLYFT